jgi:iron complex outermembrane receptor protein/vitamin B12 transporter
MPAVYRFSITLLSIFSLSVSTALAAPQSRASIGGTVVDPLGATVAQAAVVLVHDGQQVATTASGAHGEFTFDAVAEGRYHIEARASGFQPKTTDAVFVGAAGHATVEVALQIGTVEQQVVVTATVGEVPQSQVGASVTVLDAGLIQSLGNTELLEPLRTVPGVAVVQTGARGGASSLFVRGGSSNFTKVLVDGVPANDIGGAFDFADLTTTGVDRVEVLRGSNSVLYGSDALAGVINITTTRGRSHMPAPSVSIDGGNLGTSREEASLGGAVARFDYFGAFSHLQTDNSVPNNAYHNNTFASRFGVILGSNTNLSGTVRHIDTTFGSPNAFDYFGVADDSSQTRKTTYASVAAESQWTNRWSSTARFSVADQQYHLVNPAPTGLRSDPSSFASFLGNPVTITGANGYSVSGRAILDFGGTYPSVFNSSVTRRLFDGNAEFHAAQSLDIAGGVRVENEHGAAGASSTTSRNNAGAFVEARASARGFLYVNGGVGFDHNAIFGSAWTPRVSVAAYLRKPSPTEALGDTKVTFNAGKGIKEPNLFQELSSLYDLLPAATANSLGLQPIGPERSRAVDAGIEQGLAGGHARIRLAYFDNDFTDLIEFLSPSVLPQLGIQPGAVAAAAANFGAYVNTQSNTSRGVELSGEAAAGPIKVVASYTYVDATVTKSLSSGVLSPAINPAFPGIQIGAFSPLVGARPFRRPANSGSLVVLYTKGKAQASLAGYFVGKRDDSTFLSDAFFGNSLLLPNQDMDAAYQKYDVSGSYQLHRLVRAYITIENAFDEKYDAAGGFPSLPRTARVGVRIGF